jgi:hypothetical protein
VRNFDSLPFTPPPPLVTFSDPSIPEVDDKSIVMFFKKDLRDQSLIHKPAMKNPRVSEAMFTIAIKYTLDEEVTLNTRE